MFQNWSKKIQNMSDRTLQQKAIIAATTSRDIIDKQLEGIKEYLESTGMGYRKPLIDAEGYPLPDIDHYKILAERQRAARLLNDRKKIENVLEKLVETIPTGSEPTLTMKLEELQPFALISEVRDKSPAEEAGLVDGDFLIKFGKAKSMLDVKKNIIDLEQIKVSVLRVEDSHIKNYKVLLTPHRWEGDGLVGCHLIPL